LPPAGRGIEWGIAFLQEGRKTRKSAASPNLRGGGSIRRDRANFPRKWALDIFAAATEGSFLPAGRYAGFPEDGF